MNGLVYKETLCVEAENKKVVYKVNYQLKGKTVSTKMEMHDEHELIEYCLN